MPISEREMKSMRCEMFGSDCACAINRPISELSRADAAQPLPASNGKPANMRSTARRDVACVMTAMIIAIPGETRAAAPRKP